MKLGSYIHLEELRLTLHSVFSLDLLFIGSLAFVNFLHLGHFLRNNKG